jgi:hypothetical protein
MTVYLDLDHVLAEHAIRVGADLVEHAVLLEEIGDDPLRWLVLGPDQAARFLELVVLTGRRVRL